MGILTRSNLQNKSAYLIKFFSLKLITFLNSMSCPTQKISYFLEKMLSNVFGIHLSYLPSAYLKNFFQKLCAVLQTAIAFLFTVLTKLFLLALYRLVSVFRK
jgi:hypothetical protein